MIPAGTVVQGKVVNLEPVPGMERAHAVVSGDFTPLKRAQVILTDLVLADGRTVQLRTQTALGLATIYTPPSPRKSKTKKQSTSAGNTGRVRQFLKQQPQSQVNTRSRGFFDLIRGPNRRERIRDFLLQKLPLSSSVVPLRNALRCRFGAAARFRRCHDRSENMQAIGSHPVPDSVARIRILSNPSSADAHVDDVINGVLSEPLFSADHEVVLPERTQLDGKITLARAARLLHRNGQLRFAIENLQIPALPPEQHAQSAAPNARIEPTQAQLTELEADRNAVKLDPEGTAKATESNRFGALPKKD